MLKNCASDKFAVPLIYKNGQSQADTCNWPGDQNDAIPLFMDR